MTEQTQTAAPAAPVRSGDTLEGFLWALAAYLFWGILPLYMKLLAHLPTLEVLAHRAAWSVPLAAALLIYLGRTADIGRALRSPGTLRRAAIAAAFVSVNWGIYVWAIQVGRALEASLGYYINPLMTVIVGAVLLGETLSRAQIAAICMAVLAVAILTWDEGGLPLVSLGLAASWAGYAYMKRTLPIGPAQGFLVEVLLLLPLALGYIAWLEATGRGHFGDNGGYDAMLFVGAGVVTAVPLIIYATGAKLLTLSTIGIMQYIAPTIVFLIAVFVFREPFSATKAVAFALIWAALAVYTGSMWMKARAAR